MRAPHDFLKNRKRFVLACQEQGPPPPSQPTHDLPPTCPNKVLLIDHDSTHAEGLIECLAKQFSLGVELCPTIQQAVIKLSRRDTDYDLVILNVSDASRPWIRFLHALQESFTNSGRAYGPKY